MTPEQAAALWEDQILGVALVFVVFMVVVVLFVIAEWNASRSERLLRQGKVTYGPDGQPQAITFDRHLSDEECQQLEREWRQRSAHPR